jgi:hypothetical protein
MKKTKKKREDVEVRPEYDLSKLRGGVRGKHFKQYKAGTNLALLEPDVRAAFPTDDAVNEALRSVVRKKKRTPLAQARTGT